MADANVAGPFDDWPEGVLRRASEAAAARREAWQRSGRDGSPLLDRVAELRESTEPATPDEVHAAFRRWFGPSFDEQALDAALAVGATGIYGDGDPAWLLLVGGAGVGKTEQLTALTMVGGLVVSTVSSEAALLSGTSAKDRSAGATGGLLRQVGSVGLLVVKDFTSILSMRREDRAAVLAALREVYDGRWVRTLGVDGGTTLEWVGRCTVVAGVTGVYDEHHGVIAAMGDRYLLLRLDSEDPSVREHATRQALDNSGGEARMRAELADVVSRFLAHLDANSVGDAAEPLDDILVLAELVSKARSQVARGGKGEPQWAHPPEMPTRVAKQLLTSYRGARLIGLGRAEALDLMRRLAHDTLPPARRLVLLDVHDHPGSTSKEVAERVGMARTTTDRTLQELALVGLLRHAEEAMLEGMPKGPWQWHPAAVVALEVLRPGYGRRAAY